MDAERLQEQLAKEIRARKVAEELLARQNEKLQNNSRMLWSTADQLSQQTAQLNVILDNTLAGIVLVDSDNFVLRSNQYAEMMFGYETGTLFGGAIGDLVDGSVDEILKNAAVDHGAQVYARCEAYCGQRHDGSLFPAEISIAHTTIKGRDHTVWFIRDITERRSREEEKARLEEELRQAQKLESLGTLASGIAHEINSPIQFIGDNLHFLQQGFEDLFAHMGEPEQGELKQGELNKECLKEVGLSFLIEEEQETLDEDEEAGDLEFLKEEIPAAISQSLEGISRVSEIVTSVRDFSHPGSKDRSLVDLNRAVKNTITISRNQWKYVAELETDFDADLPEVSCVPGEINQVILNLIVNAAQAIEEKNGEGNYGKIRVETETLATDVAIRVSDTGGGVPEELKDRIFDPFFTTKEVGKGTGQGLSLAHTVIVQNHGGKLYFEPSAEGGTTFVVLLPQSQTREEEQAA